MPISDMIRILPRTFTLFERLFERLLILRDCQTRDHQKTLLGVELMEDRVVPTVVTIGVQTQSILDGDFGTVTLSRTGSTATSLTVNVGIGDDGEGDPLAAWNTDYTLSSSAPTSLTSSGAP
jgi:rRNA pseudouridine-1189 N-methylase Emg1 (Nep1/Mra1 family)